MEKSEIAQLGAEIGKALAVALQEGRRDPEKEAEIKRRRERGRASIKAETEERLAREKRCSHMRGFPYQGLANIAWAMQSDGVVRGCCQVCRKFFEPTTPEYDQFRRIPTAPVLEGNVVA